VEHDAAAIKINTIKNIILCKKEHNATRGKTWILLATSKQCQDLGQLFKTKVQLPSIKLPGIALYS